MSKHLRNRRFSCPYPRDKLYTFVLPGRTVGEQSLDTVEIYLIRPIPEELKQFSSHGMTHTIEIVGVGKKKSVIGKLWFATSSPSWRSNPSTTVDLKRATPEELKAAVLWRRKSQLAEKREKWIRRLKQRTQPAPQR